MIHSDFHLHTSHSSDSQASMESMILKAIDLGLTKICFTEHQDYGYPEKKKKILIFWWIYPHINLNYYH